MKLGMDIEDIETKKMAQSLNIKSLPVPSYKALKFEVSPIQTPTIGVLIRGFD